MGKTLKKPAAKKRKPAEKIIHIQGTEEQRIKNLPALQWVRKRREEIARMTPGELLQAEREWQDLKKSMNENCNKYRITYPD